MSLNDSIPEPLCYLGDKELDDYRAFRAEVDSHPEDAGALVRLWAFMGVIYETHKRELHPGPELFINDATGAVYYEQLLVMVEEEA